MRVVSVPGRLVRHPVTRRIIDEQGVLIDPHDLVWVNLIADGDVQLVDDDAAVAPEAEGDGTPIADALAATAETETPAPAAPVTGQE